MHFILEKIGPKLLLTAFSFFVFGFFVQNTLNSMEHKTFYEANDILNYFHNNDVNQAQFREVIKNKNWELVCTSLPYELFNKPVLYGKFIDEGLFDYILNIYLIDEQKNNIAIFNFDERLYEIIHLQKCIKLNDALIKRKLLTVREDPDEVDEIFTIFEFSTIGNE